MQPFAKFKLAEIIPGTKHDRDKLIVPAEKGVNGIYHGLKRAKMGVKKAEVPNHLQVGECPLWLV